MNRISRFWSWLGEDGNLLKLTFLMGVVTSIIGGGWTFYLYRQANRTPAATLAPARVPVENDPDIAAAAAAEKRAEERGLLDMAKKMNGVADAIESGDDSKLTSRNPPKGDASPAASPSHP